MAKKLGLVVMMLMVAATMLLAGCGGKKEEKKAEAPKDGKKIVVYTSMKEVLIKEIGRASCRERV